MAELEWPESIRERFPKLSLRDVLLLQAHIRGFIARSHMKHAREEFIEVFNEIQDGEDNLCVFWKSQFLCLPSFTTAKKGEEPKCFRLKSDGPRDSIAKESNSAITKDKPQNFCGQCDNKVFGDDRLSTTSPQLPVKTSDEAFGEDEEHDSLNLFSNDQTQENENLPLEFENKDRIHQFPVSKNCFERSNCTTAEQDSESVKGFVTSDESQPKSSKSASNKQGYGQAQPANGVCIPKVKDVDSQDPSNDGKNIDSTNSFSCFKPFEKGDKNGFQILDSSFTDVSSVWGSDLSSSPAGDSRSETPCPETVASLQLQRQNITLELVWLKQAILSRKNYLRLKSQMDSS